MTRDYDVLIVGSGHGGAQAAIALRQAKFPGSIAIVGEEPDLPYERPPLSKEYLSGDKSYDRMLIRPAAFWEDRKVAMLLGMRVVALDIAARTVKTDSGAKLGYGDVIWATGGHARMLTCDGNRLAGVHTVRTRSDVDRMIAELPHVKNAVVIGGGYIGLEAAAVLAKFGKKVVLLEALDQLLARVACPGLAQFFEDEHRAHGVDIRLGAVVESINGIDKVSEVRLANGDVFPADLVVVGIGIVPAVEPLLAVGAKGGNGVSVDEKCRTSLPHVYAIGDCALHANRFAGGLDVRLESVQNANDQANVAAKTIVGEDVFYEATPWFWSNQYDLKLQTVGLSRGYDQTVMRGDPAMRSFSLIYLKDGRVIALDCVNSARDYVQGRKLVETGRKIEPVRLGDTSISLKEMT